MENNTDRHSQKVLVTGGTGFLGSYILQSLVEHGYKVRAIRRSRKTPSWISEDVINKVEWVDGDVLDLISLSEAMAGINTVIHSAAVVSFAKKFRAQMYQVNVEGTANVVNTALEQRMERLVHISSIAALGRTRNEDVVTESKKWENNKNNTHYAITKHEAEMHVWRGFAEGLRGAILNPSTILGYGDWNQSSCAIFKSAYNGFKWYSKGINGFVGVKDVAEACVRMIESGIDHKRFILSAENWNFKKLFDAIADHFGKQRPRREATPFLGEVAWRIESIKSLITGQTPLLTRETAKVAQSKTSFDGSAILSALSGFQYTPLNTVIAAACAKYKIGAGM